jgi:hypothetical protein
VDVDWSSKAASEIKKRATGITNRLGSHTAQASKKERVEDLQWQSRDGKGKGPQIRLHQIKMVKNVQHQQDTTINFFYGNPNKISIKI